MVVSGWSTFASQAAIAWCRAHGVPYVLLVESHDLEPRSAWRRAIKGAVVPRLLRGGASVLVVGSAARESVVARGATSVRVFANTIDVGGWTTRAQQLERRRSDDDVLVLSVARLVPEKGIDDLIRAVAEADDSRLRLVVAGDGPEGRALADLAAELGVRLTILGHVAEAELAQLYVDADVFALLSCTSRGESPSTRPQPPGSRSFSRTVSVRRGISFAAARTVLSCRQVTSPRPLLR